MFETDNVLDFLLQSDNWLTVRLARGILKTLPWDGVDDEIKTKKEQWGRQFPQGDVRADGLKNPTSMEAVMNESLSFQEKIVYIQKVDIFKNLAINELAAICDIAQEVTFAPEEVLFHEKEFADTMYICVDGMIAASRNNVDVGQFKAGDSFGMSAFLVDSKRTAHLQGKRADAGIGGS